MQFFRDCESGGAWPFLVRGVNCLLNCDNGRDLCLVIECRSSALLGWVGCLCCGGWRGVGCVSAGGLGCGVLEWRKGSGVGVQSEERGVRGERMRGVWSPM